MANIEFTLDGEKVKARTDETILEVARRHGKHIPTLCHDPRLEPFTSCFVCLVELKGRPGFVPSCATRVAPGMEIVTDSEEVRAARKLCLELLMSAHDADCVAPCRLQCPDNIDIQTYIAQIAAGEYAEALKTIKLTNPFPSVCGRVCPHTCELQCRRTRVDEPVAINPLKRFVADLDLQAEHPHSPTVAPESGKRVAVVGGGPAGLTAAYYLRQKGHAVTVFEMNEKAGGMLRYGIPRYRLPDDVLDAEIEHILSLGVELRCNQKAGDKFDLPGLREQGFDAVFVGVGAWTSSSMRVDGEDKPGVMPGIDYLWQVASDLPPDLGKRVVVVGGGNTAVDAARTARREGADVTILYRRTRKEMPAEDFEVDEAEHEGVAMHFLAAPVALPTRDGRVDRIRAIRMELGEPDASGRRRPVPIEGSEFEIEVDTVIAAIGQKPDPSCWESDNGPASTRWNTVQANERTFQTDVPWVFTGGDCLTGAATAVEAIAGGRKAAISIDRYMRGLELLPIGKPFSDSIGRLEDLDEDLFAHVPRVPREKGRELEVADRLGGYDEVELGIGEAQALTEALRCLECGCSSVDSCTLRRYSDEYGVDLERFEKEFKHRPVVDEHPYIRYDPKKCILCGRCVRICLEQQGAGALGFVERGFDTTIQPSLGSPLMATDCDACGQCINTCPSGAMEPKQVVPKEVPLQPECTPVTCGFCGLVCRLNLESSGGRYLRATSEPGAFHNRGNLCVDGSFGHRYLETVTRVSVPRLRKGGSTREVSWQAALTTAAREIRDAGSGSGVGILVNGPMTNEEAYLLGRLARTRFGKSQVAFLDSSALRPAPGLPMSDLEKADRVWVLGEDPFEVAPVAGVALRKEARKGTSLVVFGSRVTRLDDVAERVVRVGQARLADLLGGLAAYAKKGKPEALAGLAENIGIKPSILAREVSRLIKARRPVVVCDGEVDADVASALKRLLEAVGASGRLLVLRRVANELGRCWMGLDPACLPLGLDATSARDRGRLEELWGDPVPAPSGKRSKLLDLVKAGKLGALVVINTDPFGAPLLPTDIHSGIFTILMDLAHGPLAVRADVLLPASGLAESSGTVTGLDGRILPTSAFREPASGKNLFQVLGALADAMGASVPLAKPHQVWAELDRLRNGLGWFAGSNLELTGKMWTD